MNTVLLTSAQSEGVGGVQVLLADLARTLERHGREVHLLHAAPLRQLRLVESVDSLGRRAFSCPLPGIVRGSVLLSIPLFLAYLPISLFHLIRLIRARKIDVINCHYLDPYFIHLVLAGRLMRVPVVVSVHGADVDACRENIASCFVFSLIMRGAHRIVACSRALAARTAEAFPSERDKVVSVHNGLDVASDEENAEPDRAPQRYILSVCRHVRKKGVDTLLHAFALVVRECPSVSLVTAGDGPLFDEHRDLARKLDIDTQVAFVGQVPHEAVSAFFAGCELFVLPSRDEPFGLVLLEAAQQKKAIVCTRVGGVPEIITNGVDGVIVEPDDPAAMASEIVRLLDDPVRRDALGRQAHHTLMTRFLWQDRIHEYLAVYEGRQVAPETAPAAPGDAPRVAAIDPVRRDAIDVIRTGR